MDLKKQGKNLKRTLMGLKYSKKPKYDPKKVDYGPNNEPIKPENDPKKCGNDPKNDPIKPANDPKDMILTL